MIAVCSLIWLCACSAQSGNLRTVSSRDSWEHSQGGVATVGIESDRASVALYRIAPDLHGVPLTVKVLATQDPVAFSFPDGSVYIARGLVDRLTSDELAAAIAHELGHMLHDGALQTPASLRGQENRSEYDNRDIEQSADVLGRGLLLMRGIPSCSLPSALSKVADASKGTPYYEALVHRVTYLNQLDARVP